MPHKQAMMSERTRKRQRSDELFDRNNIKRRKLLHIYLSPDDPTYDPESPPAFWDSLSEVPLTQRALRELNRRNNLRTPWERVVLQIHALCFEKHPRPDTRYLRGFCNPSNAVKIVDSPVRPPHVFELAHIPREIRIHKGNDCLYDEAFEMKLADYNVHIHRLGNRCEDPLNATDIQAVLAQAIDPIPPSQPLGALYQAFHQANKRAFEWKEKTRRVQKIMETVVPMFCGPTTILNKQQMPHNQLSAFLGEHVSLPKPRFVDGAPLVALNKTMRDREDLKKCIIPCKSDDTLIAPNFFLEVRGPGIDLETVTRRAGYAGAIGARGIHALQNHLALHNGRVDEVVYDHKACSFSATYDASVPQLRLYGHYMSPPAQKGGLPWYYMAQLGVYYLETQDQFIGAVTAFRNLRELAKQYRDDFIKAANAQVS